MKFKTSLQDVSAKVHNKNIYLILAVFALIFSRYFICEAYSFLCMHNHGVAFSRSIIGRCFLSERGYCLNSSFIHVLGMHVPFKYVSYANKVKNSTI